MKQVIASSLLSDNIVKRLSDYNIGCLQGFKSTLINNETAYHPDMLFYRLKSEKLLTSTSVHGIHNLDINLEIELSKSQPKDGYPEDCVFNCFYAKKHLICGKSAAKEIVEDAIASDLEIINVKQGYCACSTIKLNDEAFISSDTGIVKALKSKGYDVLLVRNEGVLLKGYNNGFIGGCALSCDDKVLFTGKIENHVDYENIKAFSANYGKTIISLDEMQLYDYGGFVML